MNRISGGRSPGKTALTPSSPVSFWRVKPMKNLNATPAIFNNPYLRDGCSFGARRSLAVPRRSVGFLAYLKPNRLAVSSSIVPVTGMRSSCWNFLMAARVVSSVVPSTFPGLYPFSCKRCWTSFMSFFDNSCVALLDVSGTLSIAPGRDCSGLDGRVVFGASCDQDDTGANPTVPPIIIAVKTTCLLSIFIPSFFRDFVSRGCVLSRDAQWPCQLNW